MAKKILNKRSNELVNGGPKLPSSEQLDYGEFAVNYAAGYETLSMKNSANEIVTLTINGNMQTVAESLAMHEARNDNPHGVTKAQVGLGNVDNTADIDKPLSTAQTTAVNLKLDKTAIADNLTTNSSTVALSAKQGIELNKKLDTVSGGTGAQLTELFNRVAALEEEVDDTEAQANTIIAKEDAIILEFSE